jgi:hypothetical protein
MGNSYSQDDQRMTCGSAAEDEAYYFCLLRLFGDRRCGRPLEPWRCCGGAGRLAYEVSMSIPIGIWQPGQAYVLRPLASDSLFGSVAPMQTIRIQPLLMASLAWTEASSHPLQASVACSLSAVVTEASSQYTHSLVFLINVFSNGHS